MKFFRKLIGWFYRKKVLSNGSCRVRVLFCAFRYWPKERIRNFEKAERELEQIKGILQHVKQELDFSNGQLAIKNKALIASLNSLSEAEKMGVVTRQQLSALQEMFVAVQQQLSESQKMGAVTQQQLSELQDMFVAEQQQLSESQKKLVIAQQQLTESQKMGAVTQQQLSESQKKLVIAQQQLTESQKMGAVTQQQLSESQRKLVVAQQQLTESQKMGSVTKQQLADLRQQYRKSESSVTHFRNKLKHLVICPETIRRDGRFIVSDDFYQRSLLNTKILKYEIVKIKLKDIRREWDGNLLSLTECHPYRYLEGDVQQYLDYTERNKELGGYEMSAQRFNELIHFLSTEGYDSKHMPFINENNVIYDGQHRCCFLMKEYGGEFEIDAVRIVCAKF